MLQSPYFVKYMATQGLATPTYAYANNNPLNYTDPTGLYTLKGECPNYKAALDLARKTAGCGAGKDGKTDSSCKCQKAVSAVAGSCDICQFLDDGSAPDLYPKLGWWDNRAHTNAGTPNVYRYLRNHTEDNSVAVQSGYCTAGWFSDNISALANLLIHEATHYCAAVNGGAATLDPATNDVANKCL